MSPKKERTQQPRSEWDLDGDQQHIYVASKFIETKTLLEIWEKKIQKDENQVHESNL